MFLLVLDKTCELPYCFSLFIVNFENMIYSQMIYVKHQIISDRDVTQEVLVYCLGMRV